MLHFFTVDFHYHIILLFYLLVLCKKKKNQLHKAIILLFSVSVG